MTNADFHVHTTYCDGRNSPEEIVLEAIRRGMKRLGFSGHSFTPFDTEPCMSAEGTRRYIDEIHALRDKYSSQIDILCGTECDYYSDINPRDYDYIIGSVHYVECRGTFCHIDNTPERLRWAIDECFNGDAYALVERYYSLVSDVVRKTDADIIGHFDLITKLNRDNSFFNEDDERYINASNSAVDSLIGTRRPFEINTGALSRGCRDFPYPSMRLMKYIAERGGTFILSSDSHSKETLMYDFPKYEALAQSLGLKVCTL